MSRRGGGYRPEQRNPAQSFQRGGGEGGGGRGRGGDGGGGGGGRGRGGDGGGGRGRGGGGGGRGGRSGGFPTPSPSESYPPLSRPSPSPQVPSASSPVPVQFGSQVASTSTAGQPASSSSTSAATLSREVEKLTLQSETPAPASAPAPAPEVNIPPSSSKSLKPPPRPGFGTVGQKVIIRANHFLVDVVEKDLHHYDVTITPEVTSKKVNRDVINELVRLYKESHLGKRSPAYDGRKSLYTAGSLPFISKEFVVKLVDRDNQAGPARREREFRVAIKFAAKADLHHLQQFLQGRQQDAPQETIQFLDVVLREAPSNKYTTVGRSFFSCDLGPTGELGDGLEYWRGFYQSLRPTQMGLSLNIDVSARSFYEPILVTQFVAKYLYVRELGRPLSDRDRVKVAKALKGLKVEISYRDYVKRYKVTGVSAQPTNQLMFSNDEGNQISVAQYFHERYSIVLRYPLLPSLQAANGAVYPMELCTIVKGQRYTKKLNEKQVTALLRATCQRPHERERSIKQMVRQNNYNSKDLVNKEFGIEVKDDLTVVNARVLPAPRLKYHDSGRETNVDPRVGQWNMINKKMVNGGTLEYWACISFSSYMRSDMVFQFCEDLVNMCSSKGMAFNPNPLIPTKTSHPGQIERALLEVHSQSTAKLANMGQNGLIKRVCETELGIVSQCCQPRQAQKLSKQYLENLSLKINVKVGGRNTVLFDAIHKRMPHVSDRPTIIFGADVTHPQPGEDSTPSIAAVVASMDWPEVTKYRGLVSAQPRGVEMIEDLYKFTQDAQRGAVHGGMIRELLIAFRRSTGHKPHRIIFYRDGVSEGQFSQVLILEMDAIRKACASLEEGYLPRVTFVVVQKRHHTRFFTDDRNQMDRSGNILPGTVVDTKICHPTEFDFYLNSHAGIQGTSRPAHYHVLYDENNFTADQLQMLTNNLCYTYARCTRSVSLVPPAYYAHLAAFRARYYIEGIDSSDGGSASGGRNTRDRTAEVRPLPAIKDNVKDVMFYC